VRSIGAATGAELPTPSDRQCHFRRAGRTFIFDERHRARLCDTRDEQRRWDGHGIGVASDGRRVREREQRQVTITNVAMVVEAPMKEDARTHGGAGDLGGMDF
jgi:hypothetical protein